ncbi:MAG: EamA family transporter RarD [Pseudomonadota bacterium]
MVDRSVISPAALGLLAMVVASVTWGLSALFYKVLSPVPPLEVLAHRTIWSLVFFLSVLGVQGRLTGLARLFSTPKALVPGLIAALLISTNWFGFIFSVQTERALEASLGYFIFPLVAVALGVLIFGERLRRAQAVAVAMAAVAVVGLTLGLGVAPWIALGLALTFGLYGSVKKASSLGPVMSTAAEVLLLLPLALLWLWGVHVLGWTGPTGRGGGIFGTDLILSLFLVLAGPMTGLPLLLFSYASQRVGLIAVGLVQYLNPTLQFAIATLVFGEVLTPWHVGAFALIWAALAVYSGDTWRAARRNSLN